MPETKRISFDRPQNIELSNETLELIRDPEPLIDGWERVYTNVSVADLDTAPDKIRFGTGGEDHQKWHEEESEPEDDIYYNTEKEYHCRALDRGVIGVYGGADGDEICVNWHGYDKRIGER